MTPNPRRPARTKKVEFRVDSRTKRMLAADAKRRGKTVTDLLLDAWRAYSPAAAGLSVS